MDGVLRGWVASAVALCCACGAPEPPGNTGGTGVDAGVCGRGLVVVETDYQSSNVSLVGVDGAVLSASLLSSASTGTALSAPLGGDVVVPTPSADGSRLVLIDRYPASVLTWVEVASGAVSAQLRVGMGFSSNPQDYVPIDARKAYVPRFESNPSPGREPFDEGGDVLIVDPSGPRVTGRVDLTPAMAGEDPRFLPRANRALALGGSVFVLLSGYARDWSASAESRLVRIDPSADAIREVLVLRGLHGCGALAPSPDGDELAVACTGGFERSSTADITTSAVVRVALEPALHELARYRAASFGAGPAGFGLDYAAAGTLVVTTFGSFGDAHTAPEDDTVSALTIASGEVSTLLRSRGVPFSLGEVRCVRECEACFVTDAETGGGVVRRFQIEAEGRLSPGEAILPNPAIGMPPRYLGRF
ncbi:MAG: hypothetical protein OZ921_08695 [Sorangiineae bacterium]|nr:hypothetical protein [Polyangiaceae bacterium]MEB2322578.1 hypothetical protein [Sorangiineae bacterium]